MKQNYIYGLKEYLFFPNNFQKLSLFINSFNFYLYANYSYKRAMAKQIEFGIPIISVGNIIVGGSGKTPVTINLASNMKMFVLF